MLLDKIIKINLKGCRCIKHYENLGYKIPRRENGWINYEEPFYVNVKDLPKNSHYIVKCSCDYKGCNKILNRTYQRYNQSNHDGKTYCRIHAIKTLESGTNHWCWDNNKTQEERENKRHKQEYYDLVKRVLKRDNYTCQCCNIQDTNRSLEVHHLDGYNWCKDKRFDECNAITLCKNCHKNFHSIYGYKNNTKEQFLQWMNKKEIRLEQYYGEIPTSRWAYCIETQEIIKNIIHYCKYEHKNLHASNIYACCNKKMPHYKNKHYVWYEEYINKQ